MPYPSPAEKLIVALDVDDLGEAVHLARILRECVGFFKVGLALFTRVGPEGIKTLKKEGIKLFLDLKFHDIPAVVRKAAAASAAMGVDMFTVHTSGGTSMMEAAAEGVRGYESGKDGSLPIILGVTVLTSLDSKDLTSMGYHGEIDQIIHERALLAKRAGLDGVVASAGEAKELRRGIGSDLKIVTPGIRPGGSDKSDQKRVATPAEALRAGSDYLVIGRPITTVADPLSAARNIIREMEEA